MTKPKTIIESIRDFIKTCPYLPDYYDSIGVDYINDNVGGYMILQVPGDPVVKKYVNGNAKKQCIFTFASTEPYGADTLQNLENLGFYEKFAEWIDECNVNDTLPELSENKESLELEVETPGYLFDAKAEKAQYRIQCRLIYFEEKKG